MTTQTPDISSSESSCTPVPSAPADELSQLRQLLLGRDVASLNELRRHVLNPQQRTEDVAEILDAAITAAVSRQADLATALNQPVEECIRLSVQQKPQQFADALFPVMGPAIRKSISETLRAFVRSTNQMIEQSVSLKSLLWRWEARRSGVPFTEIVLKHSLVYRIDEVFLIQTETGLLIEHVSHPDVLHRDSDAISAMLTVIRDFSRDSFSLNREDTLSSVEIGDRTLWVFEGPNALLACINRGIVPESIRLDLQTMLERLHDEYAQTLTQFDGDRSRYASPKPLLEQALRQEVTTDAPKKRRHLFSQPATYLIVLLLLGAGYEFWQYRLEQTRINAFKSELMQTPGVVVFEVRKRAEALVITGLRDPLAVDLEPIARKHNIPAQVLRFELSLYQSLEPALALQRAHRLLQAPDSVTLTPREQSLVASGVASESWLKRARSLQTSLPGFERLDLEQMQVEAPNLQRIRQLLQAPDSITLEVVDRLVHVSGTAPYTWIQALTQQPPDVSGIDGFRLGQRQPLLAEEAREANQLIQSINTATVTFIDGSDIVGNGRQRLNRITGQLQRLQRLAQRLQAPVQLLLTGEADGLGSPEDNLILKRQRADAVRQHLLRAGIDQLTMTLQASNFQPEQRQQNFALRCVRFNVIMKYPSLTDALPPG